MDAYCTVHTYSLQIGDSDNGVAVDPSGNLVVAPVDGTDIKQKFTIIPGDNGSFYIFSISAAKFVRMNGFGDHGSPNPVTATATSFYETQITGRDWIGSYDPMDGWWMVDGTNILGEGTGSAFPINVQPSPMLI